ncbi:hypothetical protein F3Y22_tig00008146pilonHSYRG00080 [Hibiscus syriacus]|uniref:GAG-pre-integrase domain-containing protein n=1 Tax=Hibiscus syriacus TaxID=106335 RepID=A0A6A3CAF7_HIBSY|nr:hypothetical protein F3Y22_tig00008146pilonHSYRG00080 [Hibiscus syriacus]
MANTSDDSTLNFASSAYATSSRLLSTKKINVILDDHNYLLWHQQVFLTIKTHRLQKYIDSNISWPTQYVTRDGVVSLNPEYELYEEHDGALASWFLSTVSEEVLPHLIGLNTAAEIWNTLHSPLTMSQLVATQATSDQVTSNNTSHSEYHYKNELVDNTGQSFSNNNNRGRVSQAPQVIDFQPQNYPVNIQHQICPNPHNMSSFPTGNPNQFTAVTQPQITSQAYIATPETVNDNAWYPDSGVTHHITKDLNNLQIKETLPGTGSEDGGLYKFDVAMNKSVKNDTCLPTGNGLHVNDSAQNFSADSAHINNSAHNSLSSISCHIVNTRVPMDVWHKRLGHPSKEVLFSTLKHYNIERQFGVKLKVFQSDGGGEFGVLQAYMKEQGIVHRMSCPHTL